MGGWWLMVASSKKSHGLGFFFGRSKKQLPNATICKFTLAPPYCSRPPTTTTTTTTTKGTETETRREGGQRETDRHTHIHKMPNQKKKEDGWVVAGENLKKSISHTHKNITTRPKPKPNGKRKFYTC